jgi:hypothetical protein
MTIVGMRAAVLVVCSACTVPPPFHTLETPETVKARHFSIMAGGGGGTGQNMNGCCGGAAARVRYGIDDDQDIGVDGDVIFSDNTVIGGAKLSYKHRVRDHVSLLGGPGVMFGGDTGKNATIGGDVGAIVSVDLGDTAIGYSALRLAIAVPLRSDAYATGGLSQALVLPVGVAIPVASHLKLIGELGGIGSLSEARMGNSKAVDTYTALGFYGVLAISYTP